MEGKWQICQREVLLLHHKLSMHLVKEEKEISKHCYSQNLTPRSEQFTTFKIVENIPTIRVISPTRVTT